MNVKDKICACGHWWHLHQHGTCRACGCTRKQAEPNEDIRSEMAAAQRALDAARVGEPALRLSERVKKLAADRDKWERRARELESLCADRL